MEMCREEHLGVSVPLVLCCYELEGLFWLVVGICVGKGLCRDKGKLGHSLCNIMILL